MSKFYIVNKFWITESGKLKYNRTFYNGFKTKSEAKEFVKYKETIGNPRWAYMIEEIEVR